jgi:hypothetical protein
MSQFNKSETFIWFCWFGCLLLITLFVWVLRGLQILPFLTSGVIWVLLLLSMGLGAIALFSASKRY